MTIDNTQDLLDSRDIIEKLSVLISELSDLDSKILDEASWIPQEEYFLKLQEEYLTLLAFASECEIYAGDWIHGVTLIHEDYFEKYQDDLIADCYELHTRNLPRFIKITLDYDMLKQDYTSIDFDGVTYYFY